MDLGPHAAFIWSSYGAVAVAVGGLAVGLWLEGRRYARELALIEAQGLGRRGDSAPASGAG